MKHLLLIEDSIDDRELIKRAIKKAGYEVEIHIADNGIDALEILGISQNTTEKVVRPNLVMLDLKIPKLSGKEVLRELRNYPTTMMLPVVVFTSSREESDLKECYQLHVNSFIRKPVNADDFNKAIQQVLDYWLKLNELP
jgi:two-component system response regulator